MGLMLLDEHLGQVHPAGEVRFAKPRASIRELIRARVELEIERHKDARKGLLVRPGAVETALNGDRGAYGLGSMFVEPERENGRNKLESLVAAAERAFTSGRYYILLGDRQAESLDEMVELDLTGEATFLLLTPLQGG